MFTLEVTNKIDLVIAHFAAIMDPFVHQATAQTWHLLGLLLTLSRMALFAMGIYAILPLIGRISIGGHDE